MNLFEEDEDEGGQDEAPDEVQGSLFDGPCQECGDEDDVRKTPSNTFTGESPDPDLNLCAGCRMGHKAFYDAVAEEAQQAEDAEEEKSEEAA